MGFPYSQIFNQWDPLSGPLPVQFNDQFVEVARKARNILQQRTSSDIHQAQKFLDTAYKESQQARNTEFEAEQELDFVTWQRDFREVRDHIQLNHKKNKQKFAWHENCAMVALAITGSVALFEENRASWQKSFEQTDKEFETQLRSMSLEILEKAVGLLEMTQDFLPAYGKKQKAGQKSRKTTTPLKEQFIEFMQTHEGKYLSEAARRFYRNRPDKSLHLKNEDDENIVRYFSNAYRDHKKSL